jgi:starvation-inducible outer membrane lipoprotein
MRRLAMGLNLTIVTFLLSACMSAPTLETAQQTTAPQQAANSQEYSDACAIVATGADRNGQRLPKRAVKAIKAELASRQVDCSAYGSPNYSSPPAKE